MQNKTTKMKTQIEQTFKSNHPLNKYKKISLRNNAAKDNMPLLGRSVKQHLKQILAEELSTNNQDKSYLAKIQKNKIQTTTKGRNRIKTQISGQNKMTMKRQRIQSSQTEQKAQNQSKSLIPTLCLLDKSIKSYGSMFSNEKQNNQKKKERYQVPGPGRYLNSQIQYMNKTSFTFSKAKKFKQSIIFYQQKQRLPGPGKYNIQNDKILRKNIIFEKAQRNVEDSAKSPGPSDYKTQISLLKNNGGVLSKAKRLSDYKTEVPGPARYNQVPINLVKNKSKIAVIGNNKRLKDQFSLSPGPSHYNKERSHSKDKIVGGVICTSPRMTSNSKGSILPSSFSYNPSFKCIEKKGSAAVIGTQPRFPSSDNLPFLLQMSRHLQNSQITDHNSNNRANNRLLNDLKRMNETMNKFNNIDRKQKTNNGSSLSTKK